jgi:hypothetical protein
MKGLFVGLVLTLVSGSVLGYNLTCDVNHSEIVGATVTIKGNEIVISEQLNWSRALHYDVIYNAQLGFDRGDKFIMAGVENSNEAPKFLVEVVWDFRAKDGYVKIGDLIEEAIGYTRMGKSYSYQISCRRN